MEKISKHLYVSGRVQGVGFRYFVATHARELGINGWVKNLPDGQVEAVFTGSKSDLDLMLNLIKKGPSWAEVNSVRVNNIDPVKEYPDFLIK
jgi:acylphosphatase